MNTNLAANTRTNWRLTAAKAKSPYDIAVGRAISLFRVEAKMSILQLSLNCGISSRRLGRIERGTEPISLVEVQLLAEALGLMASDELAIVEEFQATIDIGTPDRIAQTSI